MTGFTEKIIQILTDNSMRQNMGEQSLKIVKERYSLEKHIEEIEKVYEGVICK